MPRVAVIDMGSNSTRLLVADLRDGGNLEELVRRTRITRLAQGVDSTGRLSDEAIGRVLDALSDYKAEIDELGAERVVALATSAVRDASNGQEFRELLRERFGFDVRILSGDEEATLTFLGATSGRAPDGEPTLVIDIGGGSTEFVVGAPGQEPSFHVSTQAGAVRQTERHITADPPPADDIRALAAEVRGIIEAAVPLEVRRETTSAIAVAGTATSVAAIDQRLEPYDPERVHGYRLELGACERALEKLAAVPEAERRQVPGLNPDRAPTIVAGVAILIEAMRAFDLDAVEVSEADILQGAALSSNP
ncbi:MAG: exopolyphosphatase / guanosine-5-triphosphate,3-diphosphate pyrophosphatase [Solirubrobacteraceae bacterium]|nr:exopolyphosphatase / guanosine-5-triphosphate,3-diphosphate pyrophosphatase [Solirubrobacteraceae bacterium]